MAKVRAMGAEGIGATEIARALKIGRASVYRALSASTADLLQV
jgi:DNA invertase Pin-like site-specific DNA recombinase